MNQRTPLRLAGWGFGLLAATLLLAAAGLAAGSSGWSLAWQDDWTFIADIRAPRTLGTWLTGALLGLGGALAQGLFRNPLADPYLLGSAAGAVLAVSLVLAVGGLAGTSIAPAAAGALLRIGLAGAAFGGATAAVLLTLMLAGGAGRPLVLLLAGVVVAVVCTALSELLALASPEVLRARQAFMLGSTGLLGWPSVALLAAALALVLLPALALARLLDALVLGEAAAASLGLPVAAGRMVLVLAMALATGAAVSQAGLIAFVGLVAPHLVRWQIDVTHRGLLAGSALVGGALLLTADLGARLLMPPQELPVGALTALGGGIYLLALLRRRGAREGRA